MIKRQSICSFAWGDESLDEHYGTEFSHISISKILKGKSTLIQEVFNSSESLREAGANEMPSGVFWHELTFSSKLTTTGEISGVVAFIHDVTERKQVEEDLQKTFRKTE